MRRINLIVAVILLASCGSQEADNRSESGADIRAEAAVEANATAGTDPEPVAQGNTAVANANSGSTSPCLVQGADQLAVKPLRALGTEPFWSARVEGRCVTYSTPEDQQGVRVWTRYSPEPNGGGVWVGQLGGKTFELRTLQEPGCSDGMSDERYPMAAEISVSGEQRRGCAKPL
jgi:uncharacterized membrane protein